MNKFKDINELSSYVLRISNWEETQRYKSGNKNFNNDQPWFKFNARKLLGDLDFMSLSVEHREFLIMLWALASSDNGYLPEPDQIAFMLRRDNEKTKEYLEYLLKSKWLLEVTRAKYMTDNNVEFINPITVRENTSTDYND